MLSSWHPVRNRVSTGPMSTDPDDRPTSAGRIANTGGMTDTITLTGVVATAPKNFITSDKLRITTFRLACAQRRFDRSQQRWVESDTNWYTISAFRQLADNVTRSIAKGERVIVTGRLRIRDWTSGDRKGTNVDVEADSIGHDLSWGTAVFTRNVIVAAVPAPEPTDGATDAGAASAGGGSENAAGSDPVIPVVDEAAVPF